jgi:hypothetical protein
LGAFLTNVHLRVTSSHRQMGVIDVVSLTPQSA